MAFTAFSRGQVLDRLRSAALLSPIAHMRQVNSPIARVFADTFLAEVRQASSFKYQFIYFIQFEFDDFFFFFFLYFLNNGTASQLYRHR